jgi:hypothetical protein
MTSTNPFPVNSIKPKVVFSFSKKEKESYVILSSCPAYQILISTKNKNKKENFRFAQTFKDGANSRRSSSMSNFYFSFNFVSFFSYSRKMIFNGFRKKTTTSFYVDVMKTKLTTFICCFTEFNEHKKNEGEPSGR